MAESYSIILHISHLRYPFMRLWTLRLLPYHGFHKQCCYEHWGAWIFLYQCFSFFLDIYLGMELLSNMVVYFQFSEDLPYWFPQWLQHYIPTSCVQRLEASILWVSKWIYKFESGSQVALVIKKPPANSEDIRNSGSIPGTRRYPGRGHGNPRQCSCLENPMVRRATVQRVTKNQT